jgi:hypothetical protein
MTPYKKIFQALNKAKIRYLVVGGVAANLHGVERATADLDLIVHLAESNLLKFAKTMTKIGYRPKAPVKAEDFAKKELRQQWIREKNMIVFSFINPKEPLEMIDIFVKHPLPFESTYKRRQRKKAFGIFIPVMHIKDLIKLKQDAGRPKDLYDIGFLERIAKKK